MCESQIFGCLDLVGKEMIHMKASTDVIMRWHALAGLLGLNCHSAGVGHLGDSLNCMGLLH